MANSSNSEEIKRGAAGEGEVEDDDFLYIQAAETQQRRRYEVAAERKQRG